MVGIRSALIFQPNEEINSQISGEEVGWKWGKGRGKNRENLGVNGGIGGGSRSRKLDSYRVLEIFGFLGF